jgi:hypothetical protein
MINVKTGREVEISLPGLPADEEDGGSALRPKKSQS